jgi:uncharacterized protein (TIGR01777 family)
MRVLMAGSSGFLGTKLTRRLRAAGHDVTRLVRRETQAHDELRWDPAGGDINLAALSNVDAVINLAGAGAGDHRWTAAYKRTFRASRVEPTRTLAEALAELPADARPATLLNASAVGFYGDSSDQVVDEKSPPGSDFLADVCRDWEAATVPAEEAGVRVVRMRTGLPLAADGGLLKPMLLPFRFGLGARLGSGQQYWPWISMPDWLSAVEFVLSRPDLAGPLNFTGPHPVTNAAFTRALARALHRPAVLVAPRVALRALLGEFGDLATASQRAVPAALNRAGFGFAHPTVDVALRAALRRDQSSE